MKKNVNFWKYLAHLFLLWEMFQTKVVEKIKTHILRSVAFFENHAYEMMWTNIVQTEESEITI
jgi:hypothetical protein